MGWLGKIVGGTIGLALGGPLGAVAGAAFGHAFVDKREDEYLRSIPGSNGPGLSANEEAQLLFFTAAFSMLAKISKADGRINEEEIKAVERFMVNDLQLDQASRETAKNIFRNAVTSSQTFEGFAEQFYSVFKYQSNIIELMMDVLLRVSSADGSISDVEEQMLLSASRIFRFSLLDYNRLKSRYVKKSDPYYAVLQCDENASNEEIKKKYRTLVQEYHPDKIQAKGLPEEFVKFATDKFTEIHAAYEHIRKCLGF